MKTIAIIQARMGATRLPGKVMLDLEGKTILERVFERVSAAKLVNKVLVATTNSKVDLKIIELCRKSGIQWFVGSEEDVLDRYYKAAIAHAPDNIVRITADCPLMDPVIIDKVIDLHLKSNADYTSNVIKETYPDGEDVEVFTFVALEKAWNDATLSSEREHVTSYIRKKTQLFKLVSLENNENLASKRWTLDELADYEFISEVYKNLYGKRKMFGMEDILILLKAKPELENINSGITRNEGYTKSLKNDSVVK